MSKKVSPATVGLFTLSGIALAVAGVVIFGSGRFFAETMRFVLYFDGSVKGLVLGADVKFRGVSIGAVTEVGVVFNPKDFSFAIPVMIEVDLDRFRTAGAEGPEPKLPGLHGPRDLFAMLVERGLRAELKLESLLTGRLFVEIDFHPDTPIITRALPDSDFRELPTVQSKLEALTKTIETIPFEQVVQKVTSSLDAIERLLNSPELAGSIRGLEQTLQEVKKLAGGFDQTLGEARDLVQEVRKGSGDLNQLLVNLAEVTAGGDDLREELGRSLRELMEAARSLRLLADTIEARPDVFLRGKGPGTGGE